MSSRERKIVVIRHSFVHWFKEYLSENPEKNPNFGLPNKFEFHGLRGGKIQQVVGKWKEDLRHSKPQTIVLVAGCNDIDDLEDSEREVNRLGRRIAEMARELHRSTGAEVMVLKLFPR